MSTLHPDSQRPIATSWGFQLSFLKLRAGEGRTGTAGFTSRKGLGSSRKDRVTGLSKMQKCGQDPGVQMRMYMSPPLSSPKNITVAAPEK